MLYWAHILTKKYPITNKKYTELMDHMLVELEPVTHGDKDWLTGEERKVRKRGRGRR